MNGLPVRTFRALFLTLSLALLTPGAAAAQTEATEPPPTTAPWAGIDAIGYGGLGFGLGVVAAVAWGEGYEAVLLVPGVAVVGAGAGTAIGRRAQNAIRRGDEIGGGHRAAVLAGAVLAGATGGAVTSMLFIRSSREAGTPFGSDEETVATLSAVGAALGTWFAWAHRGQLSHAGLRVLPTLDRAGRPGVSVSYRF